MDSRDRIEQAQKRFDPQLEQLRTAFNELPSSIPYQPRDSDSRLAEAGALYDDLSGAGEHARVSAWFKVAFGSVEQLCIPERGGRLSTVIEILDDAVEAYARGNCRASDFDELEDWIYALLQAAKAPRATAMDRSIVQASGAPTRTSAPTAASRRPVDPRTPTKVVPKSPKPMKLSSPVLLSPQAVRRIEKFKKRKATVTAPIQTKLDMFPRLTRAEQAQREAEERPEREARRAAQRAAENEKAAISKERARAAARERQRLHRARVKAALAGKEASKRTTERLKRGGRKQFFTSGPAAAAATHRPERKRGPKAKPRAPKRKKATWARSALFPDYEMAVRAAGGFKSAAEIVRQLHMSDTAGRFIGLTADVLRKWISRDANGNLGWSPSFLARIQGDGVNKNAGRKRVVVKYADVFGPAFAQLRVTRAAHAAISVPVARGILLAHARRSGIDELIKCTFSKWMVHDILRVELGWSMRASTRAAQKIPDEWEALCLAAHARITFDVRMTSIKHPCLLVNGDQGGF
ncbi:hypothetical protein EXIGLDRAFT_828744 [Exidia glandulosa HHB12029]|uniref:Uncharacterized protein n=1 Tax=Exidia glandulosa HHB12029 TaxID=1314781 RepID=A0A165QCA1_EXIGL|nr:hypothetical protein EXIGLDRAFT_828744 [Exidia glandulosa HHB12029]